MCRPMLHYKKRTLMLRKLNFIIFGPSRSDVGNCLYALRQIRDLTFLDNLNFLDMLSLESNKNKLINDIYCYLDNRLLRFKNIKHKKLKCYTDFIIDFTLNKEYMTKDFTLVSETAYKYEKELLKYVTKN